MKRAQSVRAVWNWLPAFRAIAEFQSIHGAAKALHISPSALSRSLSLLEAELDQRLFVRTGRVIRLAPAGEAMLGAVRTAMRVVDDGIQISRGRALEGNLVISAPEEVVLLWGADAAKTLRRIHPGLSCRFVSARTASASLLLRGDLDVILSDRRSHTGGVANLAIGSYERAFCSKSRIAPRALIEVGSASSMSIAAPVVGRVDTIAAAVALCDVDVAVALPVRLAKRFQLMPAKGPRDVVHVFATCRPAVQAQDLAAQYLQALAHVAQAARAKT